MPKPLRPPSDRWLHERGLWNRGLPAVAGIDEVGRGPLAGPVVAAAAILDEDFDDPGITDSKALTPAGARPGSSPGNPARNSWRRRSMRTLKCASS